MVWTPPKQFNSGEILTARDLNIYLRDNMLENEVTKCTTAGSHLSTDSNGDLVERSFAASSVDTSESKTGGPWVVLGGGSYTGTTYMPSDLGTLGPSVTVETGTSVLCMMSAKATGTFPTLQVLAFMGVDVPTSPNHRLTTYSTTNAVGANQTIYLYCLPSGENQRAKICKISGLTPGMNTFRLRYNDGGNSATPPANKSETNTFSNRRLVILPL